MKLRTDAAFALRTLKSNKGLFRRRLKEFLSLLSIMEHLTATSELSFSLVSKVCPDFR